MPLTPEECRVVFPLAWDLPPERSPEFIREIETALAGHPERCMLSERFGQLAWQFKRMSGSSG